MTLNTVTVIEIRKGVQLDTGIITVQRSKKIKWSATEKMPTSNFSDARPDGTRPIITPTQNWQVHPKLIVPVHKTSNIKKDPSPGTKSTYQECHRWYYNVRVILNWLDEHFYAWNTEGRRCLWNTNTTHIARRAAESKGPSTPTRNECPVRDFRTLLLWTVDLISRSAACVKSPQKSTQFPTNTGCVSGKASGHHRKEGQSKCARNEV